MCTIQQRVMLKLCLCVGLSVCPGCSKNEACDLLRLYCSNAQFRGGGGGQVHRLYQALWIFFFILLIRPHRPIKHIKQEARLSQRGCIMLRVIDYFTISLKVIRRSFENCNFQRLYNLFTNFMFYGKTISLHFRHFIYLNS